MTNMGGFLQGSVARMLQTSRDEHVIVCSHHCIFRIEGVKGQKRATFQTRWLVLVAVEDAYSAGGSVMGERMRRSIASE